MTPRPWKILDSEYLIRDRWMTLRADRCQTDSGLTISPYYVQELGDWVHVVAFNPENEILVTRQYRHGSREVCIEIPCGCIEMGESPEHSIQRELLEETGCIADSYEALPVVSPNPARYSNKIHPIIAYGVRKDREPKLDESEEIEFEFLSIQQVLSLIDEGKLTQALHIGTIFMALRKSNMLP